ncbi:hypothetical protein NPIL_368631 [Nephila pilipes]|uniref:Uncharacterized protein n=1 Tax=Nephila pilipes TaxID=299642 RepID=A0A8X6NKE3_NEPPI|nr:hypothetical protein NPIL_664121 [Nephila pilipes]GFT20583.1 hypothetical protein NPIL_368631 [Nephila pilipes]
MNMEIGPSSRVKASGRCELVRRLCLSLVKVVSRQRFSRSGMATSDLCRLKGEGMREITIFQMSGFMSRLLPDLKPRKVPSGDGRLFGGEGYGLLGPGAHTAPPPVLE